jgi:iron complex outermembrane recepter protein
VTSPVFRAALVPLALAAECAFCSTATAAQAASLADLTLEQLTNIQVTSVSGSAEPLAEAPASIYVITSDDIRRSGVRSLPEALRLAPNLQVGRINAGQYAISARGFNNTIGNKLLVLIDGRTVYTPLFSGVFWDMQDVMLEDVERIEVISGPGATLWGVNAVNGVINVITRPARDTVGPLLSLGAGNLERQAAFRHGGRLDNGAFRIYGKTGDVQNTRLPNGTAVPDGYDFSQVGFRAGWGTTAQRFTVQGDAYSGRTDERGSFGPFRLGRIEVQGQNLLGRWSRRDADGSNMQVQAYIDQSKRMDPVLMQADQTLFDISAQYGFPVGSHALLFGAGYRHGRDTTADAILAGFRPIGRDLNFANIFVQDQIRLRPHLELSLGIRLEHNDYTGLESLPSVRLGWRPSADQLVWSAYSRAVRAPSRFDREIFTPLTPAFTLGGPNFEAEVADVFEIGYRGQPTRTLAYSATAFYHEWDKVRSGSGTLPLVLENKLQGPVYGVETWTTWQAMRQWRLAAGLTTLRKHLRLDVGSTDPLGQSNVTLGNDPEYQWMLRSSLGFGGDQELDALVRHVATLPAPRVSSYTALDVRYAWRVRRDLELSLTADNLLDRAHAEFAPSAQPPSEIGRGFFVKVRWQP